MGEDVIYLKADATFVVPVQHVLAHVACKCWALLSRTHPFPFGVTWLVSPIHLVKVFAMAHRTPLFCCTFVVKAGHGLTAQHFQA